MSDCLIVGAGVIGLMLARDLALHGMRVTLIDKQLAGQAASWAGGGIVSPLYPWRYSDVITRLASWSQGYYPQLSEQLCSQTSVDPEYRQNGLLLLDIDDEAKALNWSARHDRQLEPVDRSQIGELEPNLGGHHPTGLWMPAVGSVRNPRLLQALKRWVVQSPDIRLLENCGHSSLLTATGRAVGVSTQQYGVISAKQVVVTAGAWTADLLAPHGVELPVVPVRGQMVLYRAQPGLVKRITLVRNRYVIPRADGRVLVGSSLEYDGFNRYPTVAQRYSLQRTAEQIIPALQDCVVENHWAGLRPGSPNGIPFIGPVPDIDGLFVSAGHFRNGLVLAPASTHLLSALIRGETPEIDPQPYAVNRKYNAC